MRVAEMKTWFFDVGGSEYSAVAESKFAAKAKLKSNPNVPSGLPLAFLRSEPYVAKSVNPVKAEEAA